MKSNRHPFWVAVLFPLCAFAAWSSAEVRDASPSNGFPEYHAQDPNAQVVTEKNLLASERFWPYQTALTKPLKSVPVGSVGVLIRVDEGNEARVDFGRDGLFDLPVGATDLVERSNATRLGKVEKEAPNFLYALGPRLLDPATAKIYPFEDAARNQVFVCFADPWRVFGRSSELEVFKNGPGDADAVLQIVDRSGERTAPGDAVVSALRLRSPPGPTRTRQPSGTPLPAIRCRPPKEGSAERRWSSPSCADRRSAGPPRRSSALRIGDGSVEISQTPLAACDPLHCEMLRPSQRADGPPQPLTPQPWRAWGLDSPGFRPYSY
jgi:hypothetical protein